MSNKNDTPTFNMKVVVQETGLTPDTLRAWERRYGMPQPQRTEGGHRLYSQYQIDALKWLIARQDEGLSISRAVDLWRQIEAEGQDPLKVKPGPTAQSAPVVPQISGERITDLREAWIKACLKFDEYNAQYILSQAFAIFSIETVCFELLQKALAQIGEGWFTGTISVQQEHFASALALRQVEALLAALPPATKNGRLIVGCAPKERHTFSALMLTLMFRQRNWDVVYLGADIPIERLETSVQHIKPEMVILVAHTLYTAGNLLALADLLYQQQIPLAFGGAVFTYLKDTHTRIPGHFLGNELPRAPERVEQLLQIHTPVPKARRASPAYQAALAHFLENHSAINTYVYHNVNINGFDTVELNNANEDLGNNIISALTLGSMDLLDANIAWVKGMLVNYHHRMPDETMEIYLKTYHKAVQHHLDDRGQPIKDWFDKLINNLI